VAPSDRIKISLPFLLEIKKETDLKNVKCEFKHEPCKINQVLWTFSFKIYFAASIWCYGAFHHYDTSVPPLSVVAILFHTTSFYKYIYVLLLLRDDLSLCSSHLIYIFSSFVWIDRINPARRSVRFVISLSAQHFYGALTEQIDNRDIWC
jgi:hypothetical protein